jgi:hypothetical protein
MRLLTRISNALVRELQRLWAGFAWVRKPQALTPSEAARIAEVFAWVRQYLGRPHPQLGRAGAVCPFAQPALDTDQLRVTISDDDGASRTRLRALLLEHAAAFAARLRDGSPSMYASLVVVFPRIPEDRFHLLDQLHDELKTSLMTSDIMVSPFHPKSERPALWNPAFHVLRAPFAGFAFRKMDVRDIVFVASNRNAFAHYRTRFGRLFAQGEVSDEHGYATAYAQAISRFGDG